jgi:predicted SAM-dependent methyltransferase
MSAGEIKLHLGCGPHVVDGWVNVDLAAAPGVLQLDLRGRLPYGDDAVDAIFHEHLLEHLTKAEGRTLLEECHRILKPGGAMRVGWPDMAKLMRAYALRRRGYRDFLLAHFSDHRYGAFWDEILSDWFFDWGHRYAYTRRHLTRILEDVGFRDVKAMRPGSSAAAIALDFRRDPTTTFVEGVK